jgi:putative Holliday junction resolvase
LRVLAIDYGTKSIGLAICDELQLTTRPLGTIRRHPGRKIDLPSEIQRYVLEYEIGELAVGLPLNMDGTRGESAHRVEHFIEALQMILTIPIHTIDERLTSSEADERLRTAGKNERERRKMSDEYAAVIILEDFLATRNRHETKHYPDQVE